ncbi:MAG: hypothetical protein J6L69_07500 [Lachnospiraceae bacterium]|nr:hypothetical protein [Lachnospiraceae bacterium]
MNNEYKEIKEFESKKKINVSQNNSKMSDNDKLKILWILLFVLFVILIIAMILTNSKDDTSESKEEETSNVAEEEVSGDVKDEDNTPELVASGADDEVYKLMTSYIDAAYVQGDMTLLEPLVDSMEAVNIDNNEIKQRYIESYNNIEVYMLDSDKDISVVFVRYDVKLNNFETLLPAAEFFLVKKDADSKLRVHNIGLGEKYEQFMSDGEQVTELNILIEKIQSEYNAVIDSNSEIKSVVEALNSQKSDEKKVE